MISYFEWKRKWFNDNFINPTYDWLYFPDTDRIVSYEHDTGLEVQMTGDDWKEHSRHTYMKAHKAATVDEKLDKIIKLLEK